MVPTDVTRPLLFLQKVKDFLKEKSKRGLPKSVKHESACKLSDYFLQPYKTHKWGQRVKIKIQISRVSRLCFLKSRMLRKIVMFNK